MLSRALEAGDLTHWDITYWSERLRESKYDINEVAILLSLSHLLVIKKHFKKTRLINCYTEQWNFEWLEERLFSIPHYLIFNTLFLHRIIHAINTFYTAILLAVELLCSCVDITLSMLLYLVWLFTYYMHVQKYLFVLYTHGSYTK